MNIFKVRIGYDLMSVTRQRYLTLKEPSLVDTVRFNYVSNLEQVQSLHCSSSLSCMHEYLVIDSGGYLCMNSLCALIGLLLFCSQQQAVEHIVTAACQPPHHSRLSTMTNSTTNIILLLQLSGVFQ